MSETALWASVVVQAFADAFAPTVGTSLLEREHALRFLLDDHGAWAARRDEVAGYINREGGHIREHARAIYDGREELKLPERQKAIHDVAGARALYGRESMPEKPAHLRRVHPDIDGTWLCFDVREDGTLILGKGKALVGLHDGLPLPNGVSYQARVMREMTKPFGASLITLRKASGSWFDIVPDLCAKYDLELVVKRDGVEIGNDLDAIDGETKAHLRRRLPPDA